MTTTPFRTEVNSSWNTLYRKLTTALWYFTLLTFYSCKAHSVCGKRFKTFLMQNIQQIMLIIFWNLVDCAHLILLWCTESNPWFSCQSEGVRQKADRVFFWDSTCHRRWALDERALFSARRHTHLIALINIWIVYWNNVEKQSIIHYSRKTINKLTGVSWKSGALENFQKKNL